MKKSVNYKNLRLSNLGRPQYRHLLLLFSWVGFFLLFYLTENFILAENCYVVYSPVDDWIPFCEWFLLPYVGWYFLVAGSLMYFLLYNVESFKGLQTYIIVTQVVAMTCYILFPTRQDLRPEVFPRENVLTELTAFLYRIDTNTGVCPSLHVAYSLAIASAWMKEKGASILVKAVILVSVILICMSVVFIKQHSVLDIVAAIPMCALAEWIAYGRHKKKGKSGR